MIHLKNKYSYVLLMVLLPALITLWLSKDFFFFWDTVQLASKHAHWFYENQHKLLFLPGDMDSGHIPFWGYYLALFWTAFGKSLFVSHLAVFPFLLMYYFFLWKIAVVFAKSNFPVVLNLLLMAEPVMLAQSVLVSPDVMLMAMFIMHWYFVEKQMFRVRSVSAIFLVQVSLRGTMTLLALEIYFVLSNLKGFRAKFWLFVWPLIPAVFIFLFYHVAHFYRFNWFGWHQHSPWQESFAAVDTSGFLRNHVIFIWRFLDYGRWIVWLGLIILSLKYRMQILHYKSHFLLLFILLLMFYEVSISRTGLMAHRYFLPVSIIALVLFYRLLSILPYGKNAILVLVFFSLLTGHFWIYPKNIAQGWDATLAHIPYYQLRKQMHDSIEKRNLDIELIGSDFPDLASREIIFLQPDVRSNKPYSLEKDSLLIYSNIFNNFTDAELKDLENWKEIVSLKKYGVEIILYQK